MTQNTYAGDFVQVAVNGYDLLNQIEQVTPCTHGYSQNKIQPDNVGVEQYAPGILKPTFGLNGFTKRAPGGVNAHNLFSPSGVAVDTEYIALAALGANNTPVAGDLCVAFDGTLLDYTRTNELTAFQKWQATLRPRGVRIPAFPALLVNASQKGNLTSAVYDDGAESVDTVSGGVGILEVLTPTGTQATGWIGKNAQPSDANNYAIGPIAGTTYTYTFKTSLTVPAVANEVLIGSDAADTAKNLYYALIGDPSMVGTKYSTGTVPLPSSLLIISTPVACVITLTAVNSGVITYALAATGANLAVSGATMTGGVAGETATIVIQHSTSSGGAYTTIVTFTLDMTVRGAQVIAVPVGTVISRYLKVVVTMSAATMTWAARIAFARWFSGQA